MYREQIERINSIKASELLSRDGFFGKPVACYLSYQQQSSLYKLNVEELRNRFPVFSGFKSHELAEQFISKELIEYSRGNIFQKLWWRLSKPIDLYFHVYHVISLAKLAKSLETDHPGEAKYIYERSALPKLVTFRDRLFKSWSSYLELFFASVPDPKEDSHSPSSTQRIARLFGIKTNTNAYNPTDLSEFEDDLCFGFENDLEVYHNSIDKLKTINEVEKQLDSISRHGTISQERVDYININLNRLGIEQQLLSPVINNRF